MRNAFADQILEMARRDDRIFIITPDLGFSVLEKFKQELPKQFLNVGIAEQNAVGVAAGLALSGKVVYVYSIIPFVTMRPFEQVRVDVAYMNTNVRLVGVGAGLAYGPQGGTHHSIEDIAIMRSLPNMTVCCPGDPVETKELVRQSIEHPGPIYFRLNRSGDPIIHEPSSNIKIGKVAVLTEGNDLVLFTTSNMLEVGKQWTEEWAKRGKNITLISVHTIKPLDIAAVRHFISRGIPVVTLEEHNIIGGLGSAVAEVIAESGLPVKFKRLGIQDQYSHIVGSQRYLREKYGLLDMIVVEDMIYG